MYSRARGLQCCRPSFRIGNGLHYFCVLSNLMISSSKYSSVLFAKRCPVARERASIPSTTVKWVKNHAVIRKMAPHTRPSTLESPALTTDRRSLALTPTRHFFKPQWFYQGTVDRYQIDMKVSNNSFLTLILKLKAKERFSKRWPSLKAQTNHWSTFFNDASLFSFDTRSQVVGLNATTWPFFRFSRSDTKNKAFSPCIAHKATVCL